jgi:beta-lactamase class C
MDPDALDVAFATVASWVDEGVVPGAVALVARRGRIAGTWAGGVRSREPGTAAIGADTVFPIASITKVATATAFLRLADERNVSIETPVRAVLPEWRVPGVDHIKFRHLLSHTSGLPEDLPPGTLDYEDANSLDTMLNAFMEVAPVYAPEEELVYSNIGYGILGRAIERMSGMGYREAVWSVLFGPLWMNDSWFGNPPLDRAQNVATIEGTDHVGTDLEPFNGRYWRGLGHSWGGMFSTAADLAKMAQVFLDNGKPILDVATALTATRNWTNGLHGGYAGRLGFPLGDWGLGWEVKGSRGPHWTGELTSHATFCHIGGSGTMLWADPMRDLICVLLANRSVSNGWHVTRSHKRWATFSDAVVRAAV